jgi:mannan endo-1,4-beta-mannosidase
MALLCGCSSIKDGGKTPLASEAAKIVKVWSFEVDTAGWEVAVGEHYAYRAGEPTLEWDNSLGEGMVKVMVRYDASVGWSEPKIKTAIAPALDLSGCNTFSFDFYFDPSVTDAGSLQYKVFSNDGIDKSAAIVNLKNGSSTGTAVAGNYRKVQVTTELSSGLSAVSGLTLGIIGGNTDYSGAVFIDNIAFSYAAAPPGPDQTAITKTPNASPAQAPRLNLPASVQLADGEASAETARLYAYLKALGDTDKVIYGHQNDMHHKRGAAYTGSTQSDTKDITGSFAGIMGIDTLSIIGNEYPGSTVRAGDPDYAEDPIAGSAALSIHAAREGAIITVSTHFPNFDYVKESGDWNSYTPGLLTGEVMLRILPGGDLNGLFNEYLDKIAAYARLLDAAGVPVLFRPFHEHNGSWFWWGRAFCTPEAYKNVVRYTVEYLRDIKGVHNFLYVYSPNGPFSGKEDYLERYPGDEYIDVIAFDYYDNSNGGDSWMNASLADTISLVDGIAQEHGKVSAVAETGMSTSGMAGNTRKTWFTDVLNKVSASRMAYYLVWANFSGGTNYMAPYKTSAAAGHPMVDAFIDFYNNEASLFADGTGFYGLTNAVSARSAAQGSSGFILAPAGGAYLENPPALRASVRHAAGQVRFVLANAGRELVKNAVLDPSAPEGAVWYKADVSAAELKAFGAETTQGTITLKDADAVLSAITVYFGAKPVRAELNVVDDFEFHYGSDDVLHNAWTANSGAGCGNAIRLSAAEKRGGAYGMAFDYTLSISGGEGYTGRTYPYRGDWSDYDALQLWIKPDGKNQKVVVQVRSGSEDFEVFLNEIEISAGRPFAGTEAAKLVTLPFSMFKGKNNGVFNKAEITSIGLWVNTVDTAANNRYYNYAEGDLRSALYWDDIKAVKSNGSPRPRFE